jgi:hypothetical protein
MKTILAPAITALVAALSSVLCAHIGVPVWTMFIGWIAFVAGGMSLQTAPATFVCAVLGVAEGFIGAAIIGGGAASLGADGALLLGVFVIVFAALLAQHLPFANQVICYFVGMTTFFASGLAPNTDTALILCGGLLIGIVSGVVAGQLAGLLTRPAPQ